MKRYNNNSNVDQCLCCGYDSLNIMMMSVTSNPCRGGVIFEGKNNIRLRHSQSDLHYYV